MKNAYIIDAIRTPFGRYAGGLAPVRADDLGAVPIQALMQRNPSVDWTQVDDVIYGCANQAGEDNRNVGRMSALLAGLPVEVPATTVNRLQPMVTWPTGIPVHPMLFLPSVVRWT